MQFVGLQAIWLVPLQILGYRDFYRYHYFTMGETQLRVVGLRSKIFTGLQDIAKWLSDLFDPPKKGQQTICGSPCMSP